MADTLTVVPLEAVPSQSAQIILGDQNCLVRVYTKSTGLFFDLLVDGNPIVLGRICRDRCRLVRYERLGFNGDLFFVDNQGVDDPAFTGLGGRFNLVYSTT